MGDVVIIICEDAFPTVELENVQRYMSLYFDCVLNLKELGEQTTLESSCVEDNIAVS